MQYNYYLHFLFLRKINHSSSSGRLRAEPFARATLAGRWRGRDRSLSPRIQKLRRSRLREGEITAFLFPLCTPTAETVHLQLPAASSPLFSLQALGTAPASISAVTLCCPAARGCAPPVPHHPCSWGTPRPCARAGQAGGAGTSLGREIRSRFWLECAGRRPIYSGLLLTSDWLVCSPHLIWLSFFISTFNHFSFHPPLFPRKTRGGGQAQGKLEKSPCARPRLIRESLAIPRAALLQSSEQGKGLQKSVQSSKRKESPLPCPSAHSSQSKPPRAPSGRSVELARSQPVICFPLLDLSCGVQSPKPQPAKPGRC